MIDVRAIGKYFGTVEAIRDVSFTALDGQITGLLGPNGAGKSTTLRILSTVITPSSGSAKIDGLECSVDTARVRSRLGVLPHLSGLYPNLTARENIRYYGELRALRGPELERAIDEILGRLELRAIADRRTRGFSHGQKLKVALARALLHRPGNLILDEPTNGLDINAVRGLRELIRGLKEEGCCVLFSSHVMQEVAALCDRIVIIAHGRVVADGTPDEIRGTMQTQDLEEAFVRAIAAPEPA
jgi:sodium transport system ATP-binding protein